MSKRMIVKLDNFMDNITATTHSIIGNYTDESGVLQSETLLSNSAFEEYLDSLFYDRHFSIKKDDDETVEAAVARSFNNKWNVFLNENEHNFDRIAEALYTYYNPLYNYNKKLQSTNVKSGSEADSNSMIYGATSNTLSKSGSDILQNVFGATSETLEKSGKDILTSVKGETEETLTKSGSDIMTSVKGATEETLSKSGTDTLTSVKGATEKHTAESGSISDQHSFGAKTITKSTTTYDSDTWYDVNKDTEGAHTDTDTRSYTGHDIEETEVTHTDTDTRSFDDYEEVTSGATHTDTDTRSFDDYEEVTSGASHTDTDTRTFDNYQEAKSGASHTDTATHSFNNYQETSSGIQHTDTGSGSHTYNNVTDTYNENMYGNIGVMESVTMIESELRLRKHQIGLELLQQFLDLYTYRV